MTPSAGNPWVRRLGTGFLTWLVPFLAAIPFYAKGGTLLVDAALFKSFMIVVSSVTAAILRVWFFSRASQPYAREAVISYYAITASDTLPTIRARGSYGTSLSRERSTTPNHTRARQLYRINLVIHELGGSTCSCLSACWACHLQTISPGSGCATL